MPQKGILQKFYDATLQTKLIITFLLLVIIPILLLAISSERLLRRAVHEEIEKATGQYLDAAWIQYYVRADQMKFGMLQETEAVKEAIIKNDKGLMKNMMRRWKEARPYVDVWMIADKEGRVITRLNSDHSGDILDLNGMVKEALTSKMPLIATEVFPEKMLRSEGEDLARGMVIPVILDTTEDEYRPGYSNVTDALMLTVIVPVMDRNDVVGAIVTGDILNRDNFIPDSLSEKIPGAIVTIAKDGVLIATSRPTGGGQRAIGTTLPASVMSAVALGKEYKGTISILGKRYIAAFTPIRNDKGIIIGSLSVRVPEARFLLLHKDNRRNILFTSWFAILFAVAAAIFVAFKITKPLKMLSAKTKDVATGNMEIPIPADTMEYTKDEVSILTRTFNKMIREIKERNQEKEIYLSELEKKTTALTDANEELQVSKQEIEVALEEAQSQQEELQSANEELTILNEELEKKTNELSDANVKITEEEEELKKIRDRLKLIFNGIKDYIFLLDPSCTILEVNRSFLDASNLQEKDVIGKKCYNLVYRLEESAPECDISMRSNIKTPHRHIITTKDNRALERCVFPILDSHGNLVNKIEYIRDVTIETSLKQQLIQAEKLSSLGEMLSGIAHEINNPLTGVIGYCELLSGTIKDEGLKDQLSKINDSALRCKKIIENMLSFARQHKAEKRYSDINELIRQVLELKSYQLKVDNIDVMMDLDAHLPSTMVDPYMLQQVFLNIINNAHVAMVDKGGHGLLSIKSKCKEGMIRLSFSDTGTGISEANLKKIFDPFFTTRGAGKGTGLGLSVSYGIIKEHHGDIYAESRPGEGSTFYIELPVAHPEKGVAEDKGMAGPVGGIEKGSKRRILVIDDEPALLNLFKSVIEEDGHEVDAVSDARVAIEKIRQKEYDLILCDMRMPHMDGKEFYKMAEAARPEMKKSIIFTTGDIINPKIQGFLKESGSECIEKPFTPTDLKRLLSRHFTGRESGGKIA